MTDRKPTYKNRLLITKESDNSQEYITWEHADTPITEGTPLNKANLLSDAAAAAAGVSGLTDPTPSDAFTALGGSVSTLTTNVSTLQSSIDATNSNVSSVQSEVDKLKYVWVCVVSDNWSSSAPYTLTVSVPGMTSDWQPGIPIWDPLKNDDGSINTSGSANFIEQLSYLKYIVSGSGTLTFVCPDDKPTVTWWLYVPGMLSDGSGMHS